MVALPKEMPTFSRVLCWHPACSPYSSGPLIALHARQPSRYIELLAMKKKFLPLFMLGAVSLTAVPAFADARADARSQVAFGISVAQRGLWREAIYRWEKAVELDPSYAAAFNDLAIAYEHEGMLEKARKAYEKALEIDPNNSQIRQNYELFKEINDRTSGKD